MSVGPLGFDVWVPQVYYTWNTTRGRLACEF